MSSMLAALVGLCASGWALQVQLSAQPPLPAPNLLQNPGMEQGADGRPAGWRWTTAAPENFETRWAGDGRTGKCLSLRAHSGVMSGYWGQSVKVEPETDYILTGWFRLTGGKILVYAHGKAPGGTTVDERFYAHSMRNHFLTPVFLKPEYMRGLDPVSWHPIHLPFRTAKGQEWIAISAGMYFQAGEVSYDDLSATRALTDLTLDIQAEEKCLQRVRVLAHGDAEPVFDSGALPGDTRRWHKTLPGVSTHKQYVAEVTTADGAVHRSFYPGQVQEQ